VEGLGGGGGIDVRGMVGVREGWDADKKSAEVRTLPRAWRISQITRNAIRLIQPAHRSLRDRLKRLLTARKGCEGIRETLQKCENRPWPRLDRRNKSLKGSPWIEIQLKADRRSPQNLQSTPNKKGHRI
jgi:hypothetical protein